MDIDSKLSVLEKIYEIYDHFSQTLETACQRCCAACCTRNVTLTTLEGQKIIKYLRQNDQIDLLRELDAAQDGKRFKPKLTTNRLAELCIQGKSVPEEEIDPTWGSCPFLTADECPIYPLRPFGCRCLLSTHDCRDKGYAQIDAVVISVNHIFLQTIEHVDTPGCSGNLIDILTYLNTRHLREEKPDKRAFSKYGLLTNYPARVWMIPPEHRERVAPLLRALQAIRI